MASPSLDNILAEVDKWFDETIRRPPIAHDVASYNQAYSARADLKDRLTTLHTGKRALATEPAGEAQPAEDEQPKTKPAA
jgi:hypothetical protein